jgi:ribulose-phosphate 3-epimerase
MVGICPTVTAYDLHEYRAQVERIVPFAERIHIDLMDGELAPTKSPPLDSIWLPEGIMSDIHLMYKHPMDYIEPLIRLKPNMVIIHFEALVDHAHFASELHGAGIKAGLALLQDTEVEETAELLHVFDQVLIFSGNLGHHGGEADLSLLDKVKQVREYQPLIEIAWDGGINSDNAKQLIDTGVDVLNVGGYIHRSSNPSTAYATLKALA